MLKKKERGISLIALIITIIVIIILAAVVIFSSLNTPERANWARFTSDYAEIQQQVSIKSTELYGKYSMNIANSGSMPTYAEIYEEIATKSLPGSGEANGINEITFEENANVGIAKPSYGGSWYIDESGKVYYSGFMYEGVSYTTPTEAGTVDESMLVANGSYNEEQGVNSPKLVSGMIPIYFDGSNWKKADVTNPSGQWYDYTNKQWANICTVSNATNEAKGYRESEVGTVIPEADMTTMFVWIPRYAYSIKSGLKTTNTETVGTTNGGASKIEVTFLKGTSNNDEDGTTYGTDYNLETATMPTPKIVHPGFRFGSREVSGIWVAKFEASGTDTSGNYVGNGNASTNASVYTPDGTTYVNILPGAISWRYLTMGESIYRSMQMGTASSEYGWNSVNTHLIKNSEWGAVSYLCYSDYGNVPMINGAGTYNGSTHYYDMYTGAGPLSTSSESRYETYTEGTNGYRTTLRTICKYNRKCIWSI